MQDLKSFIAELEDDRQLKEIIDEWKEVKQKESEIVKRQKELRKELQNLITPALKKAGIKTNSLCLQTEFYDIFYLKKEIGFEPKIKIFPKNIRRKLSYNELEEEGKE